MREDSATRHVVWAKHLSEAGFRLYVSGGLKISGSLSGQFGPTSDGSVIEIEFRTDPLPLILPGILLSTMVLLNAKDWVLLVLKLLRRERSLTDAWEAVILLPFLLLAFALFCLDSKPVRTDLLAFLKHTLDAREIQPLVTQA